MRAINKKNILYKNMNISLLHYGVIKRELPIVKSTINIGANINQFTENFIPYTPLGLATVQLGKFRNKNKNKKKSIISKPYDNQDCSKLLDIMEELLKNGADPLKVIDEYPMSGVHVCNYNSLQQIQHFMKYPECRKCGKKMEHLIKKFI